MDLGMKDSTIHKIGTVVASLIAGLCLGFGASMAVDAYVTLEQLPARASVEGVVFQSEYAETYEDARSRLLMGVMTFGLGILFSVIAGVEMIRRTLYKIREEAQESGSQSGPPPQQQARQNQGAAGRGGRRR